MFDSEIPAGAGMEDVDSSDFIVGRRVLVQGTSKEGDAGTFYDKQTKETFGKAMDVVVLKVTKKHTLFYKNNDPEGNPSDKKGIRCKSTDRVSPDSNVEAPVSDYCKGCPQGYQCLQYDLLCYDTKRSAEFGAPVLFWITCAKTSAKPAKVFFTTIAQRRKSPLQFTVTLKADKVTTKGVYYIIQFEGVSAVSDADLQRNVVDTYKMYAAGDGAAEVDVETEVADDSIPF